MIPELEPRRYPASGYGMRADELGQQMMMGGSIDLGDESAN